MWRRYLRFFSSDAASDVNDELGFHLESKVEELVAQGWPRDRAQTEARREFGDVVAFRQQCELLLKRRETQMEKAELLHGYWQDVKYGAAQLRRSGATTMLALVTLCLGIAAVTAMFSVVDAVLLHPLPYPEAHRLISLWSTHQGVNDVVTPRNFDAWKREGRSFQAMGAIQATTFTLSDAGRAIQLAGGLASADYFRVFGTHPMIGRTFTYEDDRSPRAHVAVLSERVWRDRFSADSSIVGRQIRLNRESFTVIGVMPATFSVRPEAEQIWIPLALSGQEMNWAGGILNVVARLRPHTTLKQAQAEMNVLARELEARFPDMNRDRSITLHDYATDLTGDYKSRLLFLFGSVLFVLLIVCANVANLLLARASGRTQEFAIRAALGASRARIVRQLMMENVLLALIATVLGLFLAEGLVLALQKLGLDAVPRLNEAGISPTVICFAFGLGLCSAIISGLAPAFRGARADIQSVLRRGGRSAAGLSGDTARGFYIAGEVALSLMLLISVGLIVNTAIDRVRTNPGFVPRQLTTGRTALPSNLYRNSSEVIRAYDRILRGLSSRPGVISAALTSKAPLTSSTVGLVIKPTSTNVTLSQQFSTELHYISNDYLKTMQIPLLTGREFNERDRDGAPQVIVVNKSLAARLWPNGKAVGSVLRFPELEGKDSGWQVVGVAADVRDNGMLAKPSPVIYVPMRQVATNPWHWIEQSLFLVARTQSSGTGATDSLSRALQDIDPELPLSDVMTMDERLARSQSMSRLYTLALSLLGVWGLLLTVAGIYGVVSYFASRQRAEIGVRLALGSSSRGVILMVIKQGMRPVFAGLALGLVFAIAIARLSAADIYGFNINAPGIFVIAPTLLTVVALGACYLPARKASRIDPMQALRND